MPPDAGTILLRLWTHYPRLVLAAAAILVVVAIVQGISSRSENRWKRESHQLRKLQIKQLRGERTVGTTKEGSVRMAVPGMTQRRQLIPLEVGTGLLALAISLHYVWTWLDHPWTWLASLLIGPVCAAVMARFWARNRTQQVIALAAWLGATAWFALIWIAWFRVTIVIIALAHILTVEGWWWRYYAVRARVAGVRRGILARLWDKATSMVRPSRSLDELDRRNLEKISDPVTWAALMEGAGLKGLALKRGDPPDGKGWTLHLGLPPSLPFDVLVSKTAILATALDHALLSGSRPIHADRLQFSRGKEGASRCVLRVTLVDPLAKGCPYPGASADSIATPMILGMYEDGGLVELDIRQSHTMAGGMTGAGKSGAVNVVMAELACRCDVLIWGLDVRKRGVELGPWEPVMDRLSKTPEGAADLLQALLRIHGARTDWMAERGIRDWPTSPEFPLIVAVIDELKGIMKDPVCRDAVDELIEVGRQQGIILVMATQRPTAENLGGGLDARGNCANRIALKTEKEGDSRLILGDDLVRDGWKAHQLPLGGYAYLKTPATDSPRRLRFFRVSDEDVKALVERYAGHRPAMDQISAQALQEPVVEGTDDGEIEWEGTADEFAELISKSRPTAYRELNRMLQQGQARKSGKIWLVLSSRPHQLEAMA